jgi:hypothetical protein
LSKPEIQQVEGLEVLADDPVEGAADFINKRENVKMEELSETLRSHVLQNDIAVPGARGPLETFRRIAEKIRGRTLVKDLGVHEFTINWLTFHVPPGGKGALQITNSAESQFGFRLAMVGLGFGSGRRITLSVNQNFGERNTCLLLSQRAQAKVLAYASSNSQEPDELQVDILKVLSLYTIALSECPDCQGPDDTLMIEQSGPAIDLTQDPVGQRHEEKFSLTDDSELELGLPLPIPLQLTPSVALSRSVRLSVEVRYEFPGGYCFTPFRKLTGWEDFQFWRRSAQGCL